MRIVIDASPERMSTITYYDGIGNQIYPPNVVNIDKITDYIRGVSNETDIHEILIKGPHTYTQKILENLQTNFSTIGKITLV